MSGLAEGGVSGWFEGALRNVNFFGGRLLSGQDMADEQTAAAQRDAALALALGTGVAQGLAVSRAREPNGTLLDAVDLTPGTAVAPDGTLLRLSAPLRIRLVPDDSKTAEGPLGPGEFRLCGPQPGGTSSPSVRYGVAVQVLLAGPAQALSSERAPGVSEASRASVDRCGARWRLTGVRFRLASVPPVLFGSDSTLFGATDTLGRHRARHVAAAAALGYPQVLAALAQPLGGAALPAQASGLLAAAGLLREDEVPLALLGWLPGGLAWVDMWAARRGLHRPPQPEEGSLFASSRRAAAGAAGLQQFAVQMAELIADMVADPALDPAMLEARQVFRQLPPFGLLPLDRATRRGIDPARFFAGLAASDDDPLDADLLEPLARAAPAYPPIDIAGQPDRLIWRLRVAGDALCFGHCHLPLPPAARANRARVEAARYEPN